MCEVVRGGSPRPAGSKVFYDGDIPFLKVADLTKDDEMYVYKAESSIKAAGLKKTRMVNEGTLLLTNSGATLGVPKITRFPTTFNDGIAAFLYLSEHIIPYIYWLLKSMTYSFRSIDQGAAQPNLNTNLIKDVNVPLPPIREQKRIVEKIKYVFGIIGQLDKSNDNLQETIKQAKSKILDLAIHGKLVPQDPTDEPASELLKRINPKAEITCDNPQYGKLPKGWCYCLFSDLFQITMGQSPDGCSINNKQGVEFHQGKISFGDKYLKESDVFTSSPTKMAESQSLLLCVRAPVGVINITQREICIGRGLCSLKPNTAIILDFAYYVLATYQQIFESKSTGSTFKAISGSVIRNEILMLPPLNEQHRIVAKIEELFAQLDNIASSL